jgi:carbonic anhydrase/acetyltransferase-like protein (isoleucine patch superfamily)
MVCFLYRKEGRILKMDKKYELTDKTADYRGRVLHRIRALKDFYGVKKGDLGGWIEKEDNLSHDGACWVCGNATVYGDAILCEDARAFDYAEVGDDAIVSGKAILENTALVISKAQVKDCAKISRNAVIKGEAIISGNASVDGLVVVGGTTKLHGHASIGGESRVFSNGDIGGNARIYGYSHIVGEVTITDEARIDGASIEDEAYVGGNAIIRCGAKITHDTRVESNADYQLFNNNWSSDGQFTYTKSNKMWSVSFFYGTGKELIKKAYADSENSGKHYEAYVKFVEQLEELDEN